VTSRTFLGTLLVIVLAIGFATVPAFRSEVLRLIDDILNALLTLVHSWEGRA
jgi:hypothetical protein